MVKRLLASALVTATLFGPIAARAGGIEGHIYLPNPLAVRLGVGAAELVGACDPSAATQGVDGFWVDLSGPGATIELTTDDPVADLSLWFYDSACGYIADVGIDNTTVGGEAGSIPASAAFVIVDMLVGANASFTVSIT